MLIRDFLRQGGARLVAQAARVEEQRLSRDGGAPG